MHKRAPAKSTKKQILKKQVLAPKQFAYSCKQPVGTNLDLIFRKNNKTNDSVSKIVSSTLAVAKVKRHLAGDEGVKECTICMDTMRAGSKCQEKLFDCDD